MLPKGVRALYCIRGLALPPGVVLSDYRLCPAQLKTPAEALRWEDAITNAKSRFGYINKYEYV